MGFYGNITNTSKTQFQFDKIYSNRYDMERSIGFDGIYAGRYVLVEYDQELNRDDYLHIYIINGVIYKEDKADYNLQVRPSDVNDGELVWTSTVATDNSTGVVHTNITFYQVSVVKDTIKLTELVSSIDGPVYTVNYNIDVKKYGAGRGYDSTVWQKTYMDGVEKYIMIAELNNVVPTFDVSADAPTTTPLVPHFDTQSTDIYYKLHWQPAWGFRIAEGGGDTKKLSSVDANSGLYPSDAKVQYDVSTYNASTGKTTTSTIPYNGAIFFNKDGFDDKKHTYYENEKFSDEIAIRPSGVSGNKYNKHNGTSDVETAPDIQEIRMILPSLGNALCTIWDKIYDNNPDTSVRYQDIEWKDAAAPSPNAEKGGMTRNTETLAGCINSVHDLMGMIITKNTPGLNEQGYQKKWIYKEGDKYYRIHKYPVYELLNISKIEKPEKGELSDQEYNEACENAINIYLESIGYKDNDFYIIKDGKRQAQLFNKKALFSLQEGQSIGYKKGYEYEKIEIKGFANDLSTINGLILQLKTLIESDDTETRDRSTVQGTINILNDIINVFQDLVPGEIVIVDASGHIVSANWTTKQSFSYTNHGGVPSNASDYSTKENQWIDLSVDEEQGLISIAHKYHNVDSTTTTSDKNDLTSGNGLNKDTTKDKIALYTPIVDNTGHIVGKNTETVVLPYGFKTITPATQSIATSNPEANQNEIVADNTQDTLTLASSNKWVRIAGTPNTDTIAIGHEVHSFTDGVSGKYYGLTQNESITSLDVDNTFEVPCLKFDEAGHITGARTHTVALPENFTTIEVTTNDTSTGDKEKGIAGTVEADTLTDNLTLAEGNRWINIDADAEKDKITFSHYVKKVNPTTSATDYNNTQTKAISVQEASYDEAGHLIGINTHSHTLPDSIKTITITNSGAESKIVNAVAGNGSLIATTLTDTATIDAGNRWITLAASPNAKKATIYHAAPGTIKSTTKTGNEEPSFGATFSIPEVKYDEAGHIGEVATHTVKVPLPSLNNVQATGANVLTGISLAPTTGAFTQTNANVGTLKLTGYGLATAKKDIAATDTINGAFGQTQYRINTLESDLAIEVSDRKTAIGNESKAREDAIAKEVSDRNTAITDAINALDVAKAENIASKTIKSWMEIDGKINIETQDIQITNSNIADEAKIAISKIDGLQDALDASISINKVERLQESLDTKQDIIPEETYDVYGSAAAILGTTEDEDTAKTIYGLLKKIETLETSLTALEKRVAVLEPTTPDPGTEETE